MSKDVQSSVEQILYWLKTRGASTAQSLAEQINLTSMGARQHLLKLEASELVTSYSQSHGRGRPKQLWQLTEKGHQRFPDRHSDLTLTLIEQVKTLFGDDGLEQLIQSREQDSKTIYLEALSTCRSLKDKVCKLAEIRSLEGYMAEVVHDDKGFLLIENHCPICVAAQSCLSFCRSELQLFSDCLGVAVRREEYLLERARRCSYRIPTD